MAGIHFFEKETLVHLVDNNLAMHEKLPEDTNII